MKRCPKCRNGHIVLSRGLVSRKLGTFSLAGAQLKTSAREADIAECSLDCGFRLFGDIVDATYDPATGRFTGGHFEVDLTLGEHRPDPQQEVSP